MYKLCFFVPQSHLEKVKDALFEQGAGKMGKYDCCAWQVLGEGQFRPLPGSDPFIGEAQKITRLAEYKVEVVCEDEFIKPVVNVLLHIHPYQQVAYEIYKVLTVEDFERVN